MSSVNLYEAYSAVYNEDLRDELFSLDEDLSFIDDLTDDELCLVMENLFITREVDIRECFENLDYVLTEATVTYDADTTRRQNRTAERQKKVRIGRMQQAAGEAAKKIGSGAVKGAKYLGGKLGSAAQKIGKFLGRVGSAARAGFSAARKEYARSGSRGVTGGQDRSTDRPSGGSSTSSGSSNRPPQVPAGFRRSERVNTGSASPTSGRSFDLGSARRKAAEEKAAKQAKGSDTRGIRFAGPKSTQVGGGGDVTGGPDLPLATSSIRNRVASRRAAGKKFAQSAGLGEEFVLYIMEDLIYEGYAVDMNEALYILESLSIDEMDNLVESYLEYEQDDLFDPIFEYLLDEGYASTEEDAVTIMANMSEEWKEDILEKADNIIMTVTSPTGEKRSKIYKGASIESDYHRHENPSQIADRRFSERLDQKERERQARMAAGRLTVATKRGIEAATNRSADNPIRRNQFVPGSSTREIERGDVPTDYRARRRRASGR